jgi:UDP-N-acetylmuramoyl-tripeptide--D-alanyl-D-alanine ligase
MKPIWTSESLSTALGAKVEPSINGNRVHFNSKDLSEGDLFIALEGNNDGHSYVLDALKRGAACAVVSKEIAGAPQERLILVDDTYKALYALADYKRQTSKAKFIGITGSVGKTSTKEIIFGIAKNFGEAFASRANFNNHLGLPLNLASMPDDTEYGIFELGMDNAGELSELSRFLRPDLVVITNIAPVHLAHFNSIDDIASAKAEIFDGMTSKGFAILNRDDKYYDYFIQQSSQIKSASFGESDQATSQLCKYEFDGETAHIDLKLNGKTYHVDTTLGGHHMACNLACGLLVANVLGFDEAAALDAMRRLKPARGRGEQIELTLSDHKCRLIHDCYNAGPISVIASLKHLGDIKHPYKIAILADMRDLGANEKEYHRALAEHVVSSGIKRLYTVGNLMRELHEKLMPPSGLTQGPQESCETLGLNPRETITLKHFSDSQELQQEIVSLIDTDALILMKGSNSTGLLALADYLIKYSK